MKKTLMPVRGECLAGHFSKAAELAIFDSTGSLTKRLPNPARESGCANKKVVFDLIAEQNVHRIIVRNIGQKMLGKLLAMNVDVFKSSSMLDADSLADLDLAKLLPLTSAAQGRECARRGKTDKGCCKDKARPALKAGFSLRSPSASGLSLKPGSFKSAVKNSGCGCGGKEGGCCHS
ncbi:hypothetical protein NF212_18265 [Parasalinivibrio latis]|uniref:NifB/NifX family molybdenum-iron cluster-binding protein n=1 Tax=Parasalinivibrio latis TaxID=2952610 RepID=UPI0030E06F64